MYRLSYHSVARNLLSDDTLQMLLTESQRNNAVADVTGLLVVRGNRFMQVLEGPDDAIDATFARIQRDPRHFAIDLVKREAVATRTFGDWTMGYSRSGDGLFRAGPSASVAALVGRVRDRDLKADIASFIAAA